MIRSFSCYYNAFVMIVLLLQSCFSARLLSESETDITTIDEDPTLGNFTRFLDVGKGSHGKGTSQLKHYFQRCRYNLTGFNKFTDLSDQPFEAAVISYQTKLGLQVTGKLDSDTMSSIMSRCGISDGLHSVHDTRHFAYFDGKPRWRRRSPMRLTYAFSSEKMINYLSIKQIRTVFRHAFSRWAAVIPISFTETDEYSAADIKIGFYRGNHGDGAPFDGVLGKLGHAFQPEDGRLHLDAAETWAVDFTSVESQVAVDLESVATHEIGHILGLGHSLVEKAIMYRSLSPRTKKVDLQHDDIEAVQALYGSNSNLNPENYPSGAVRSGHGVLNWIIIFVTKFIVLFYYCTPFLDILH